MRKILWIYLFFNIIGCVKYYNEFDTSVHFLDSYVYTSGIFDSLQLNILKVNIAEPEGSQNCTYTFFLEIDKAHKFELQKVSRYFFDIEFREDRAGGLYYRVNDIAFKDTLSFQHRTIPCNAKVRYFYRVFARSVTDGNLVFISNSQTFEYN
ncbi:hypothetical protein [Schleiferia thermophila]|jgi:hypothetical protein|uniref:hypothetical protein n=1 Tax=Schleiferia thermophila TaxID=884107 RepID=UPI0004E78C0D|nr:hypothetical protein [Schleiferia thermophila]KFD39374.1 hypothetical protein AT05_05420 [Schleiferia thermophila str. Yellowstone]